MGIDPLEQGLDAYEEMCNESELKACPFCGNDGEVVERKGGWTTGCAYHPLDYAMGDIKIICNMDMTSSFYTSEKEAVKAWNHRPIEDALQTENAALKTSERNLMIALCEYSINCDYDPNNHADYCPHRDSNCPFDV